MQQNDISIVITPTQETAINTKADEYNVLLDAFCVSLTDEQRAAYFKLGDARMAFDQLADTYLHQRPDLVAPGINLPEYDKDGVAIAVINASAPRSPPSSPVWTIRSSCSAPTGSTWT